MCFFVCNGTFKCACLVCRCVLNTHLSEFTSAGLCFEVNGRNIRSSFQGHEEITCFRKEEYIENKLKEEQKIGNVEGIGRFKISPIDFPW